MRRTLLVPAAALALATSLVLGGCSLVQDAATATMDVAQNVTNAADALANIEWDKPGRIVVRDAQTSDVLAETDDQAKIGDAFSKLTSASGMARTPDAPEELQIELWQNETIKLGQDEADAEETEVVEVVTYEGSDVVTLTVVPVNLTLNLESYDAVEAMRSLAR